MSSQSINQVLKLTNAERAKAGLDPLTLNNQLTTAAQDHSDSMAVDDFFSHTGADGSDVSDRVQDAGYEYSRAGENIAAGQKTAEEVVQSWMDSPGHRANILNSDYTEIGIGYELLENDTGSVNYNHYWTQVFGTPLDNSNSQQVSNNQPSPPVESNNDPISVEDSSSNIPEQDNSDSSTIENLGLGTDNSNSLEPNNDGKLAPQITELNNNDTPSVAENNQIAPVGTIDNSISELESLQNSTPIENLELSNDEELAPQTTELNNNDAPSVAKNNQIAPVETIDNNISELESSENSAPIPENSNPLTNNLDADIFTSKTGDSTVTEANYYNDDLTGGSGNLAGGDNSVNFSGNSEQSNNNQFDPNNHYDFTGLTNFSENSWLGSSGLDSSNFESIIVENISDFSLNPNQKQLITEAFKSLF